MKTRNLILFLLCLVFVPGVWAQRISDAEAAQIAAGVLGKSVEKAQSRDAQRKGTPQQTPFYSLYKGTDGTGFVLLSLDKRAPKIIGYGDGKADINNLPPQLKYILEKQDSVLNALPANAPVHESWNRSARKAAKDSEGNGGTEGGKLLKTANWGQDYPYNLQTPEIDGQHCPTGCVATAMAIIMKYYDFPKKGRGQHSYSWNEEELVFNYQNTTFDYDLMPENFIEGQFIESQTEAVSTLMLAAGVAVEMNYTKAESGATFSSAVYALFHSLKYIVPEYYFKTDYQSWNDKYSDEEWNAFIVNELDNDRPVLYGAQSHAFVLDGYDVEKKYHINWGWSGEYNGYFAFNDFLSYNANPEIITGIIPFYNAIGEQFSVLGDVNGDGAVTMADVQMIAAHLSGVDEPDFNASLADVNVDGEINDEDMALLVKYIVGKISELK